MCREQLRRYEGRADSCMHRLTDILLLSCVACSRHSTPNRQPAVLGMAQRHVSFEKAFVGVTDAK